MEMYWPMFHRDVTRRGFTPEELVAPLKLGWVLQTEDRVFFASPTISRDICFCGSRDRHLYAAKAHSGKLLWRFNTGDEGNLSSALENGMVFVGSGLSIRPGASKTGFIRHWDPFSQHRW